MAQDQQIQVKNILQELKDKKIAVTKIEDDLKISKGYLWKVKDGRKLLSEDTLQKLIAYHQKKMGAPNKKVQIKIAPTKILKVVKKTLVTKKQPSTHEKKQSLASFLKSEPADKKVYGEKYSRKKY